MWFVIHRTILQRSAPPQAAKARMQKKIPHKILALTLAGFLALLKGCAILPQGESITEIHATPLEVDRFARPLPGDTVIGQLGAVTTHSDDTLPDLARRFDLGFDEITAANPEVDAWVPGEGKKIILPTQHILPRAPQTGLVLNVAAMRLYYYLPHTNYVMTHPAGIGREEWATPLGRTRIIAKQVDPAWHVPASVRAEHARAGDPLPAVVPPGPDNPLGRHALRLGMPGYLIHGTNKPYGIGMRVSHGCVRLYPEDIANLYRRIPVGTQVTIVNQPYLAGWRHGELYLEAHAPLQERARQDRSAAEQIIRQVAGERLAEIDWARVRETIREQRGIPLPVLRGAPRTAQILTVVPIIRPVVRGWGSPDTID